jgi:hypothetical protein
MVDKVPLGQDFSPSTLVFPCHFHFTGAQLHRKKKKLIIFISIVTGLHNKPQDCGASETSAAGLFTARKKSGLCFWCIVGTVSLTDVVRIKVLYESACYY